MVRKKAIDHSRPTFQPSRFTNKCKLIVKIFSPTLMTIISESNPMFLC